MKALLKFASFFGGILLIVSCAGSRQYECPINAKDFERLRIKNKYTVTSNIKLTYQPNPTDSINVFGVVFDRISGEPLQAVINVIGQNKGTVAHADGSFNLRISKKPFQLEFIHVGNDKLITKKIEPSGNVDIDLCLGKTVVKER